MKSINDKDIIKEMHDYDQFLNEVEELVVDLRYFAGSRINHRSNFLYLTNDRVKIILDAIKQVYGVG